MTHLEILAGRLSLAAHDATILSLRNDKVRVLQLASYYTGKAVGLSVAADLLRAEALKRASTDKPAPTVEKLRYAREWVRKARSSEEVQE